MVFADADLRGHENRAAVGFKNFHLEIRILDIVVAPRETSPVVRHQNRVVLVHEFADELPHLRRARRAIRRDGDKGEHFKLPESCRSAAKRPPPQNRWGRGEGGNGTWPRLSAGSFMICKCAGISLVRFFVPASWLPSKSTKHMSAGCMKPLLTSVGVQMAMSSPTRMAMLPPLPSTYSRCHSRRPMSQSCSFALQIQGVRRIEKRLQFRLRRFGIQFFRGRGMFVAAGRAAGRRLSADCAIFRAATHLQVVQIIAGGRRDDGVGGQVFHIPAVAHHVLQISNADDLTHKLFFKRTVKHFIHQRGVEGVNRGIPAGQTVAQTRGFFLVADDLPDIPLPRAVIHHQARVFPHAGRRIEDPAANCSRLNGLTTRKRPPRSESTLRLKVTRPMTVPNFISAYTRFPGSCSSTMPTTSQRTGLFSSPTARRAARPSDERITS